MTKFVNRIFPLRKWWLVRMGRRSGCLGRCQVMATMTAWCPRSLATLVAVRPPGRCEAGRAVDSAYVSVKHDVGVYVIPSEGVAGCASADGGVRASCQESHFNQPRGIRYSILIHPEVKGNVWDLSASILLRTTDRLRVNPHCAPGAPDCGVLRCAYQTVLPQPPCRLTRFEAHRYHYRRPRRTRDRGRSGCIRSSRRTPRSRCVRSGLSLDPK